MPKRSGFYIPVAKRRKAALDNLSRVYENWEDEKAEAIDVIGAVGSYLEALANRR